MRRLAPLAALLLVACDPAAEPIDGGADAGAPPTCADPAARWAFPSPAWIGPDGLVVPEGDRVGEAVRGAGWAAQVEALDAFSRRPLVLVPLDRAATDVDPARVRLRVRADGGSFAPLDAAVDLALPAPDTLTVQPRDPFPPGTREVLIGLDEGVVGPARPLPLCGREADVEAARDAFEGAPPGWALSFPVADSSAPMVALEARLRATPALAVSSTEVVTIAALGDEVPAEAAPHFRPEVLRGQLALPDYREDGAPFALDADGAPTARGTTEPGFYVALPATGAAPFPTVLFQHGGGGSPTELFRVGAQLAEVGFAFVAIDLPEHGMRGPAGGGGDLDFLDFDSPQATRENFRQAVADHLAVLTGTDAIDAAIEAELGVAEAIDASRLFVMGISLGAVSGSMTTSVARGLAGSALFVGGGGYPELIDHGVFALAAGAILRGAEPRPRAMLAVVQTIGDAADPLAYAIAAEDRDARPTPILFFQAIDDPLIAHVANDQWARAFGASLARPFHHDAPGMALVDLPATDTFAFAEGGPTATRVLTHNPMAEVDVAQRHGELIRTDYAQRMVTRCFTTILEAGSCEAIDTGFAER